MDKQYFYLIIEQLRKFKLAFIALVLLYGISFCGNLANNIITRESNRPASANSIQYAATSLNEFSFNLLLCLDSALNEKKDKNLAFSPFGAALMLSFLRHGAVGETKWEIDTTLQPGKKFRSFFNSIANIVQNYNNFGENGSNIIRICSAIFEPESLKLTKKFAATLSNKYSTKIFWSGQNNTPEEFDSNINKWLCNCTYNQFCDNWNLAQYIRSAKKRPAIVVLNSVYFNGQWADSFYINGERSTFNSSFGAKDSVEMMTAKVEHGAFYQDSTVIMAKLKYKSCSFAVFLAMPKNTEGIKYLKNVLCKKSISELTSKLQSEQFVLEMPVCTLETKNDLVLPLALLGVKRIFDCQYAQLPFVAERSVYVSKLFQETSLIFNKEGTIAMCLTIAELMEIVSIQKILPRLIINHTFYFIVYDEQSGLIVFMGKISNPKK